jgi:hypothetical protein
VYEIHYGGHATEGDLDAVLFKPVALTIPKLRGRSDPLSWMQHLHHSTWDHEILYSDSSLKDEQLLIMPFFVVAKNKNYELVGQLKMRIHVLFYGYSL